MSIGTFFSKVEKELVKLFHSTTWEQKAQSVITYVAPLVETIVGLAAGGPAAALVTGIINTVKSDLATVSVVVQGAQAAPGSTAAATVTAALTSINTNLASLLAAAEVKDSAKATDITATVNLITGETEALLTSLTAAPAAPAVG